MAEVPAALLAKLRRHGDVMPQRPRVHIPQPSPVWKHDDAAGRHSGQYETDEVKDGTHHRVYSFNTERDARRFVKHVRSKGVEPLHTSFAEGHLKHVVTFGVKNDGRGLPKHEVLDTLHKEMTRRGGRRCLLNHRGGTPRETGGTDSTEVAYEFKGNGSTPASDLATAASDHALKHAELKAHLHSADLMERHIPPTTRTVLESHHPFDCLAQRAIHATQAKGSAP